MPMGTLWAHRKKKQGILYININDQMEEAE